MIASIDSGSIDWYRMELVFKYCFQFAWLRSQYSKNFFQCFPFIYSKCVVSDIFYIIFIQIMSKLTAKKLEITGFEWMNGKNWKKFFEYCDRTHASWKPCLNTNSILYQSIESESMLAITVFDAVSVIKIWWKMAGNWPELYMSREFWRVLYNFDSYLITDLIDYVNILKHDSFSFLQNNLETSSRI